MGIYSYKNTRVVLGHSVIRHYSESLMKTTADIIDFASYSKRKQAQQRARAMWEMYARNAGLQAYHRVQSSHSSETHQA